MTVYNFGGLAARFDTGPWSDDDLMHNWVPGTELPPQDWTTPWPLNLDFGNNWFASVIVDNGYNPDDETSNPIRDAKIVFQVARFDSGPGSFVDGNYFVFTDLDSYQKTTVNGTTQMYPWHPFVYMWSHRSMKAQGHQVSPGRCVFVMPSDEGSGTQREFDHLWLFIVDCDSNGNISYTRHLVHSVGDSISGVAGTIGMKTTREYGVQVVGSHAVVYWSFFSGSDTEKTYIVTRSVDTDTLSMTPVNVVLDEDGWTVSQRSPYYFGHTIDVQGSAIIPFRGWTNWDQFLLVVDGTTGEYISLLDYSASVSVYGAVNYTYPLFSVAINKFSEERFSICMVIDGASTATSGTVGIAVLDMSFSDGVATVEDNMIMRDENKRVTEQGTFHPVTAEVLPNNRLGVFTTDYEDYWADPPLENAMPLNFFIVDMDSMTWEYDGTIPLSWDSDMGGGIGYASIYGVHINGWWAYLGRNRGEVGSVVSDPHGWPLGYYSISFQDMIPSLRLKQRDDDNEFGSSRIERVQVSSAQRSGRIPGPNTYW